MIHDPEDAQGWEARRARGLRHLEDVADAAEDLAVALAAMSAAVRGLMPLARAYDALHVAIVEESSTI